MVAEHYLENKGFVVPIMADILGAGEWGKIVKITHSHIHTSQKECLSLELISRQGVKSKLCIATK